MVKLGVLLALDHRKVAVIMLPESYSIVGDYVIVYRSHRLSDDHRLDDVLHNRHHTRQVLQNNVAQR